MARWTTDPLERTLHANQVRSMLRSNEDPMKMELSIGHVRSMTMCGIDPLERVFVHRLSPVDDKVLIDPLKGAL